PDHVLLESGERLEARAIVCAMDPSESKPSFDSVKYQSVGTHYFTGASLKDTRWGKWLVLIPKKFGFKINHLCLMSEVAPCYSSNGEPLLCANTLGSGGSSMIDLCNELDRLAGRKLNLKHLKSIEVLKALPKSNDTKEAFIKKDGVYYCGDRWSSPSINGALRSGRLTAEAILRS
ncbi:MAG: hypothetical protein U1E10_03035, partial [Bdellovibrionales bacterium]|nr:hypothetical protein [Bdellovibrionales bacterium]